MFWLGIFHVSPVWHNIEENIINHLFQNFRYSIFNIVIMQSKIVSSDDGYNEHSTHRIFAHNNFYGVGCLAII